MIYLLYALFILSCLVLIASVLLQPGKSDAGALFTSSVSSTAFGPRGTLNILSKITIAAAAVFMLSAFLLGQQGLTGGRSVLESGTLPAESPAAATDANANSAVATENAMGANTNSGVTVNNVNVNSTANTAATATNTGASNASAGNTNAAASPAANTATANQAANKE
ncbi:MAG: preprotein translocase subunit SecG [Acidobacteriota bacterium]|nr:preprotein translocase subunit SecG [Acidobacteriota bacterium]